MPNYSSIVLLLLASSYACACTGTAADAGVGGANNGAGGQTAVGGVPSSGGSTSSEGEGGLPAAGGTIGSAGGIGGSGESGGGGGAFESAGGAPTGDGVGGVVDTGGSSGSGGGNTEAGGTGSGGAAPCVVDHAGEAPSLSEYFSGHFALGAAIDTQYNNYADLLTKHFNSVTAEDQMKFDALQPSEGNFTYNTADQMVNFALGNGMQVRGHALVWHRQTPAWVFSGSRDQVLARMRTHIQNVMEHFQGKVLVWDVVNEAIMDDGSFRTNNEVEGQKSGWHGALGEDYIAEAFIAARQADPSAKLFYNDFYNYHPIRRQAIYDMLSGLIADGVPIDGVGLQSHLNLEPGTDPDEQSYHQTVENLEKAIEMYSSLGLDVQITEVDLSLYLRGVEYTPDMFYTPATVTQEILEAQALRYGEFFEMFRRNSSVISSVSFWGIADDNTWLSEFDSGRQDFPLLFNAQQQEKPAFWSLVNFCD